MHHRAFRRAPASKGKRPGYILGLQGVTLPPWCCLGEGGGLLQHLEPQWEVTLASQSYLGPFPTHCSREQCLTPACWLEIIQGGYCRDTAHPPSPTQPPPHTSDHSHRKGKMVLDWRVTESCSLWDSYMSF